MNINKLKAPQVVKWLAWLSLLAAFLIGHIASRPDYEKLITSYIPGVQLTEAEYRHSRPLVFWMTGGKSDSAAILLGESDGYGGPIVVGITSSLKDNGSAIIHEVVLLSNKETPPYIERLHRQGFFTRFKNTDVTDDFILGEDIDGFSGATVSARAITSAVRGTVHVGAVRHLGLKPTWKEEAWKPGLELVAVVVLVVAMLVTVFFRNRFSHTLEILVSIGTLVIIGFYTNSSVSLGSLASIFLGYIPAPQQHPIWWVMMGTVIAGIVFVGRNLYCNHLCPFSVVQDLLIRLSGLNFRPHPLLVHNAQFLIKFTVWLSLMLIFLSRHPALGSYEPFSMMFSLEGMGLQWYVLPLCLIGGLFVPQFWCRLLCPVGVVLNEGVKMRRDVANKLKGKKIRANAVPVRDLAQEDK